MMQKPPHHCRHLPFCVAIASVLLIAAMGCTRKEPAQTTPPPRISPLPQTANEPPDLRTSKGPTPNIVFVMIDTLRADRLGCYGGKRALTPNLDRFAANSVLFERCIAPAPWTQPSIASLFSSCYPGVHKVTNFAQAIRQTVLGQPKVPVFDDTFWTIAEWLRARGYATAAIVANPFILSGFGFAQGFDHFDTSHTGNYVTGQTINEAAFDWIDNRPTDKPFFLYLHYMDVHGPYLMNGSFLAHRLDEVEAMTNKHQLTAEEFENLGYLREVKQPVNDPQRHQRQSAYREYWEARYEAGVHEADRHFASLRAKLEALNLWNDALVIVASDHGEQLCERGQWDHGQSVYDTELHVPFIWRLPGRELARMRIAPTVRLVDTLPTLLDLLELAPPPKTQGVSLASLLDGKTLTDPQIAFAESTRKPPEQKALLYGTWKLISFVPDRRYELYNLAADPSEQSDLASRDLETLATLRTLLEEQLADNARLSAGREPKRTTITPEQLQRLRNLGYVGD